MRLFIEPSDVLFFRSSRPFNAGESGYLESLFPPTPETVQGAIRARVAAYWNPILSEAFQDERLNKLIGKYENIGQFRLRGLTLGQRDQQDRDQIMPLFPAPAHLLRGEKTGKIYRLTPKGPQHGISTNMPVQQLTLSQSASEEDATNKQLRLLEPEGGYPNEKLEDFRAWLTLQELGYALGSKAEAVQQIVGVPSSELYQLEPRLGIEMSNASKTTREGRLYQASFVRLRAGVGFLVDVGLEGVKPEDVQKTLRFPEKGWLALGGERRAASFQVLGPAPGEEHRILEPGERTCVYLSTPAWFAAGWRPTDWRAMFEVVPVAAAVSRVQLIGGWQQEPGSAGGRSKPLRRCVPAGSVYFFDGQVKRSGPFTDEGGEIGYGIAYKGVW